MKPAPGVNRGRRALLAAGVVSGAAFAWPRALSASEDLASLRLDGLAYQPDPHALAAAWRALEKDLANLGARPPRAAVQSALRRAGALYTWQTWNFEYLDAPFWLAYCGANHALFAEHGRMLEDADYAAERVALAASRLLQAVALLAKTFPPRDPRAALEHFRGLLPSPAPTLPGVQPPLWGDLHVHTALSYDAYTSPWHSLRFAREVAGLDFIALTDHAFYFGHPAHPFFKAPAAAMHGFVRDLVRAADEPGRFTALVGLEWEGRYAQGHRQLLFAPDSPPALPYALTLEETNSLTKLWASFTRRQQRVLTVAHHTGYAENSMGNALLHWNDRYDRLIEVVSDNGEFERPGSPVPATRGGRAPAGRSVSEALAKGMRVGIVADSDGHFGMPGLQVADTTGYGGPGGCTAVVAAANRASDLYEALDARRCYATDGQRITLRFELNGRPMGSELDVAPSTALSFELGAAAADPIAEIVLLRNEVETQRWTPDARQAGLRHVVPGEPAKGNALAMSGRSARETDQFRLRVRLANGRRAWSSPIWVDYTV